MSLRTLTAVAAVFLAGSVSACADLNVTNPNQPERALVVQTPEDLELLVASSYRNFWLATTSVDGIAPILATSAFENSSMAANFGQVERSALPRTRVGNTTADQFAGNYQYTWDNLYRAIAGANDGLRSIGDTLVIGSPAANRAPRALAFGKFVQGLAHGALALTYDQAFIVTESFQYDASKAPSEQGLALSPYSEVLAAAIAALDESIALASANSFTLDDGWMGAGSVSSQQLVSLANFYKARFRAMSARTLAERQSVNWAQVLADLDASGDGQWSIDFDGGIRWYRYDMYYAQFYGPWGKHPTHVYGMADTAGTYQTWMATPLGQRTEMVIRTPDKRYPQGETTALQAANDGKYIRYVVGGQSNPDRGTWRFSHYVDRRGRSTSAANRGTGTQMPLTGSYPEMTLSEKRLLRAEAHFWLGQLPQAVDLINVTRVGVAELPPVTVGYAPTPPNCVPRLPDGSCGNLFEALKWEWRLESYFRGYGTWYFNSRGWNDLPQGSFLHLPVPARDLQNFGVPVYTTGGTAGGSAGVGTYGY